MRTIYRDTEVIRPKFILLLLAICLFWPLHAAIDCNDPDFPLTIETSQSVMTLRGGTAEFCAKNPATGLADCSTRMLYRMLTLKEMSNPLAPNFCMDINDVPLDIAQFFTALQTYTIFNFTCSGEVSEEVVAPGVSARTMHLNYTLEEHPDMWIQLLYAVPNASLDIQVGTSEWMEGRDHVVSYRTGQVKQTIKVKGFPWQGDEASRSYLGMYFEVNMTSDQPFRASYNRTLDSGLVEIEAGNIFLRQSLDTVFVLDGVPRFKRYNGMFYDAAEDFLPANSVYQVLAGTSGCFPNVNGTNGPAYPEHFYYLEYDPQFSALFGAPEPTASPAEPPSKKKSNLPTIIGAIVAAVVVAALVIGVILATIYIPAFKRLVRPFAKSPSNTHGLVRPVDDMPAPPTGSPSETGSDWVKGTKLR